MRVQGLEGPNGCEFYAVLCVTGQSDDEDPFQLRRLALLREIVAESSDDLAAAQAEAAAYRVQLQSILASRSWRLTMPLRWVSAAISGLMNGH